MLLFTVPRRLQAGVLAFFGLVTGAGFLGTLIYTAIGFALSSLYFWLLWRIDSGPLFWVVMILGLAIGLV